MKLDVERQVARLARHEDQLPARRQDARTLLVCARELEDVEDGLDCDRLIELWRKRARIIEARDDETVPGFLGEGGNT